MREAVSRGASAALGVPAITHAPTVVNSGLQRDVAIENPTLPIPSLVHVFSEGQALRPGEMMGCIGGRYQPTYVAFYKAQQSIALIFGDPNCKSRPIVSLEYIVQGRIKTP